MATARLSVTPRDQSGKGAARALRREGRVPAVIYGHGREPQSLAVDTRALERLLAGIAAGSTVIELDLDGRTSRTLIREIQRHPFKRTILHVDFQELVAGERVSMKLPLVVTGVPEGVRLGGGVLDQILYELMIEADPSAIPSHLDVDVTTMQIAQTLHVSDLTLPAGVTAMEDAGLAVCVLHPPRVDESAVEAEGGAEPEVIRARKADDAE